jgi:opacity protein-like surface antigen
MKKAFLAAGLVALLAGATSAAHAQTRFGANLSWGSDTDLGIGARVNFGLGQIAGKQPIEGMVMFDYFFPGHDATYWSASANAIYRFTAKNTSIAPYAGAGLLLAHSGAGGDVGDFCDTVGADCSDTSVGLNLVGGIRFKAAGRFLPFVEARLEAVHGSQLVISGGAFFGKP